MAIRKQGNTYVLTESDVKRMILEAMAKSGDETPSSSEISQGDKRKVTQDLINKHGINLFSRPTSNHQRDYSDFLSDAIRHHTWKNLLHGNIKMSDADRIAGLAKMDDVATEDGYLPNIAKNAIIYNEDKAFQWACDKYITGNENNEDQLVRQFVKDYVRFLAARIRPYPKAWEHTGYGSATASDEPEVNYEHEQNIRRLFGHRTEEFDNENAKQWTYREYPQLYNHIKESLEEWWKKRGFYAFRKPFLIFKMKWYQAHPEAQERDNDERNYNLDGKSSRELFDALFSNRELADYDNYDPDYLFANRGEKNPYRTPSLKDAVAQEVASYEKVKDTDSPEKNVGDYDTQTNPKYDPAFPLGVNVSPAYRQDQIDAALARDMKGGIGRGERKPDDVNDYTSARNLTDDELLAMLKPRDKNVANAREKEFDKAQELAGKALYNSIPQSAHVIGGDTRSVYNPKEFNDFPDDD